MGFSNTEKKTETMTNCQEGGIHSQRNNKIRSQPDITQTDRSNVPGGEFNAVIWIPAGLEKKMEDISEATLIKDL